jgi:signal transduction histidine kinase
MHVRRKTLATTISIALAASTTALLAGWGAQTYRSTRARLLAELRAGAAADADRVATALVLPVWSIDREQIDRVLESTMGEPAVYAIVAEAAGRRHGLVRDERWNAVRWDGAALPDGLVREERPVLFGQEVIGAVSIHATPRFVEAELRRTLVALVAVTALVDLALVAVLWIVLWRVVLRPLRGLERYAEEVSSGRRPGAAAPEARFRGELESLRASMERMVALLDARYAALTSSEAAIHALAARLQAVREEEKTRIARDLHDELGQLLTAIRIHLGLMERKLAEPLAAEGPFALTDQVVEASQLVEQTIGAVQRIAADLRPSALDRLGLGAALRHEARAFQERTRVACELVLGEGLPPLRGDAATALYRVAQEALTNVARHAGASSVNVALTSDAHLLTLRVEDDGRGLEDIAPGPHALGLLGMRERAAILGGELTFARGRARGTVVELRIPIERVTSGAACGEHP